MLRAVTAKSIADGQVLIRAQALAAPSSARPNLMRVAYKNYCGAVSGGQGR